MNKVISLLQGADFKNNQTTKQLNNFIWANRKVELKLNLLPIGPNRFVLLFSCLVVFKIRSQTINDRSTILDAGYLLLAESTILLY